MAGSGGCGARIAGLGADQGRGGTAHGAVARDPVGRGGMGVARGGEWAYNLGPSRFGMPSQNI